MTLAFWRFSKFSQDPFCIASGAFPPMQCKGNFEKSLKFVKIMHPNTNPNPGFIKQLSGVIDEDDYTELSSEELSSGGLITPFYKSVNLWERLASSFSKSDIFCFPSIREFGGAVVLEAMACGLPCIVVNNGGIGEYVTDETGFKIEPISRDYIIKELYNLSKYN